MVHPRILPVSVPPCAVSLASVPCSTVAAERAWDIMKPLGECVLVGTGSTYHTLQGLLGVSFILLE